MDVHVIQWHIKINSTNEIHEDGYGRLKTILKKTMKLNYILIHTTQIHKKYSKYCCVSDICLGVIIM